MSDFLFQYHAIEPTSWVYLSSLLIIGLFFKFGRLFSVRNLDLFLLILLGPGLLMVYYGQSESSRVQELVSQAQADQENELETLDAVEQNGSATDDLDPDEDSKLPAETNTSRAADGSALTDAGDSEPVSVAAPSDATQDTAQIDQQDQQAKIIERWNRQEVWGFVYLFAVSLLLLARLLLDCVMVRRPLLEPNLSQGGMVFIGISLFIFLMANVISESPRPKNDATDYRIARFAPASTHGPGYELLSVLPPSFSKGTCIACHLAIVLGIVLTGAWHFRNIAMGVGAAGLYLMLPYTSMLTGRIEHVVPAVTLTWAVLMYRRPLLSGVLIGLASGLVYYPFFLLPLWLSFYWHRGFRRFLSAYLVTLSLLAGLLLFYSPNELQQDLVRMFGIRIPAMNELGGIWNPESGGLHAYLRLPVLVAFIALSISMLLWPAQKSLATLLSCSAAIMVAAQFWHGYGGGTYMAWYLPLTLLMVFRPNLEDRVAVSVVSESWWPKRKAAAA